MDEKLVFSRPESLHPVSTHYCPGCQHGVVHRILAECLDELKLREKTIAVSSIGCSAFFYDYLNVDMVEAPHGRGPAAATGVKRARPDKTVLTYQGDGDLASIGMAEIIHAANRGERFTVVFVNNTVYGMTGGQMAPTTLIGQKTTTSRYGRKAETEGLPINMAEIIASLKAVALSARVAVNNIKNILQAKKILRRAFQMQMEGLGFTFVEFLSTCPTNWKMDPIKANERIAKEMIPIFPLGVFRDLGKGDG